MPRPFRFVIALSVGALLLSALVVLFGLGPATGVAVAQGSGAHNTLRVYGREYEGAGDLTVTDTHVIVPNYVEDPPYTASAPVFNPQLDQAPLKDSVTWNPAWMSEFETRDENQAKGLYNQIYAGGINATEKVWFRMWYEPWHWDKDLNANGRLDINPDTHLPYSGTANDEWYPAVMQEFTYMLTEGKLLAQEPMPLAGQAGQTSLVFPVGMRTADLFAGGIVGQVDSISENAKYGFGLTSLDGDFDGVPDIVHVDSEQSLYALTRVAADFNGNRQIDPLDPDTTELNGNELAVLRLDSKNLGVGKAVQFLDHMLIVKEVLDQSAQVEVWYTGDMTPRRLGSVNLAIGDMALSGGSPTIQLIPVNASGLRTNVCSFPTGPFFMYLQNIDRTEHTARLMVGRAVGATHSGMEDAAYQEDRRPGDPWFLKRFYVDGHEYNVVAIKTVNTAAVPSVPTTPVTCPYDGSLTIANDPTKFKFITIRTPIPKHGEYDDPLPGYLIEQHSVRLQPYYALDYLSVLPPFNYEHYILLDVQAITGFACDEEDVQYLGNLSEPVPPILQKNGPFPYVGVGPYSPYSNRDEMTLFYVREDKNKQFLGELKEKYGQETGVVTTPVAYEFWYVEQFQTLPWEYTEFVLPDLAGKYTDNQADLYLMTSSFQASQSQALLWTYGVQTNTMTTTYGLNWGVHDNCWITDTTQNGMPAAWQPRAKFWFDPGVGGKKYKSDSGLRIYGLGTVAGGQPATYGPGAIGSVDPVSATYPVEVLPYTDPWAPFNPQLDEAPRMDSLTFNPAYMDKFYHGNEPLSGLYPQISIAEHDAREKVFLRMWYEPLYLDKIVRVDPLPPLRPTETYSFPAVLQEFTYMYLDTQDQPAHAPPGNSALAFPVATAPDQLPAPVNGELPSSRLPSFGYGLTTFDGNFDGQQDIVHLHSERTLNAVTGIQADFDGDGALDQLDQDTTQMNGNEMVVLALEDMVLHRGESVQFLDHMLTLDNVTTGVITGRVDLQFWYTGGGMHLSGTQYSLQPDKIGSPRTLQVGEMAIVNKNSVRAPLTIYSGNLGSVDGAWFVWVKAVNSADRTATLVVGRALGATHSAIDNGSAGHDMLPGDPWYLKRFFVDGHEYNVVAICTVPVWNGTAYDYHFKYITIRTPVPKIPFRNTEDSQALQGYYQGTVLGVDTAVMSVMPPFNYEHTLVEDVQALSEKQVPAGYPGEEFVFGNLRFRDADCRGDLLKNVPPYAIRIVDEGREPQFFGELKEKYAEYAYPQIGSREVWQTEQYHTLADQYTELRLPAGQKYLLTSNWTSDESRVSYYLCHPDGDIKEPTLNSEQDFLARLQVGIPYTNTRWISTITGTYLYNSIQTYFSGMEMIQRSPLRPGEWDTAPHLRTEDPVTRSLRVKFLYQPGDADLSEDIYVNTYPSASGTITGVVKLQGRTNHSGATVSAGPVSTTTDSAGRFTLSGVPVGSHTVVVSKSGYLYSQRAGVVVNAGIATALPEVRLLGGDADNDCNIDLFDLVAVSSLYGGTPPAGSGVDINGNSVVDIFDLVMVGVNFDKSCPGVWTSSSAAAMASADTAAYLQVLPARVRVDVGQEFTVTLQLQGVTNLYGVDARLAFNPNIVEVVDANAGAAGVQIQRGSFPNAAGDWVVKQVADNQAGMAWYAISLNAPAPGANGSGVLCSIRFRAKAAGYSALGFAEGTLVDTGVQRASVRLLEGSARVGTEHLILLPILKKPAER